MNKEYNKTIYACFVGYIVQAIINNFVPLLFLTFEQSYGIGIGKITMLVTFNFGIQLLVDLFAAGFADKIGYRISITAAHLFSAAGLAALVFLPDMMDNSFFGLLISVALYAIGGGLIEVLISPITESCPTDNKEKAMSLLHSFYCWGHVGVVLLSTAFFKVFGISSWRILAALWALIPIINGIAFLRVPLADVVEKGAQGMSIAELLKSRIFWILMIMMVCSGASEQSVSQWVSSFAEKGLNVTKTVGDLAGPMMFAALMGISRAFYGKYGDRINLDKFMIGSGILCICSYICISCIPSPYVSLAGCGICGLSVGIMWPGSFSKAAAILPGGGTALFALLALAGDVGCAGGPTLVGMVSAAAEDNLKTGIFAGVMFPIILLISLCLCKKA